MLKRRMLRQRHVDKKIYEANIIKPMPQISFGFVIIVPPAALIQLPPGVVFPHVAVIPPGILIPIPPVGAAMPFPPGGGYPYDIFTSPEYMVLGCIMLACLIGAPAPIIVGSSVTFSSKLALASLGVPKLYACILAGVAGAGAFVGSKQYINPD